MERRSASARNAADRSSQLSPSMALLMGAMVFLLPGCSLWGKSELKQYRAENERLLSDFRSQRDRAEQLEIEKRALVFRVKDLEGRIASISDALQDPSSGLGSTASNGPTADYPPTAPFRPASQSGTDQPPPAPALDAWRAN